MTTSNVISLRQSLIEHAAVDRLVSRVEDGGLLVSVAWSEGKRAPYLVFEFWRGPYTDDAFKAAQELKAIFEQDASACGALSDYAWTVGAVLEPASFAPVPAA